MKRNDLQMPSQPTMANDLFQMRVGWTYLYLTGARAQLSTHTCHAGQFYMLEHTNNALGTG